MPGYNQKYPDVTISTAGTGSGTGITDATDGLANIGASDAYLSTVEQNANPDLATSRWPSPPRSWLTTCRE